MQAMIQAMELQGDEPLARGDDIQPPVEDVVKAWCIPSKTSAQGLRDFVDALSPAETRTKDLPVKGARPSQSGIIYDVRLGGK